MQLSEQVEVPAEGSDGSVEYVNSSTWLSGIETSLVEIPFESELPNRQRGSLAAYEKFFVPRPS